MAKIEPAKPRSRITDTGGNLEIIIPPKRNWFLVLFLGFWLTGWTIGGIMAIAALFLAKNTETTARLFIAAWLGGWFLGEIFAAYTLLWSLAGKEIVSINGVSLFIKRDFVGRGPVKEFDLTQVKNLRCASALMNPFDFTAGLQFWGIGGGNIAFDYGAKTFRFGAGIDEAEAKLLVLKLKERYKIAEI